MTKNLESNLRGEPTKMQVGRHGNEVSRRGSSSSPYNDSYNEHRAQGMIRPGPFRNLKKGALAMMLGASLMGTSGCATMERPSADSIYWKRFQVNDYYNQVLIIEKNQDLYLRHQHDGPFSSIFEDRRLTNSPDIKESDVRVWDNGELTYFSHESNGGHWYSQPIEGDDTNRTKLERAPNEKNPTAVISD